MSKIIAFLVLAVVFPSNLYAGVTAYFNQNSKVQYVEPYRKITRRGDNLEAVLIRQIRSAKKSVYLAVQELRLPLIAQALIDKKKQGLDVRVIIERDYNFSVITQRERQSAETQYEASKLAELKAFVDMNRDGKITVDEMRSRDAIYMLKEAQVPLKDDSFDSSSGSGLMHHKFVVVDGVSVSVTSANFTMSCIHGDILTASSRGNPNSLVLVDSAASFGKIFQAEFLQMWGGRFGQNKTYRGPQTVVVGGVKITAQFSPTSRRVNWSGSVNGLMASHLTRASRSIDAALFVFSDQELANSMEGAQTFGAKVRVLVEKKFVYRDYSEVLDLLGVSMLNSQCGYETNNNPWRIPVTEVGTPNLPAGDVLHHKFAVIDRSKVIMGSQNWSEAANAVNDETLLVIESGAISDLYGQEFERIKKSSSLGITTRLQQEIQKRARACGR